MPRSSVPLVGKVEHLAILDEQGRVDESLDPDIPPERLLAMHRIMLLARRFDERRLSLQRQGAIGTFAPVKGQEAAQVGPMENLIAVDWFVPAFRESAAALHRGAEMSQLLLYDAGYNEGAAQEPGQHDLPIAVPVASQLPHAAGIAYALVHQGSNGVVMTFFGDGATSEGDFHEALNFAAVFQLPVVFVCQNNQWAISTPRSRQTASRTLAEKAFGYGMPGVQVDGNDLLATYAAARDAVVRAREGGGPTLIEALTYRMEVHTTADDPKKYRDEGEVAEWARRDPIERLQRYLLDREQLDRDGIDALEKEIADQIEAAWADTRRQMERLAHEPAAIFDHVTGTADPDVAAQRQAFLRRRERTRAAREQPGGDRG